MNAPVSTAFDDPWTIPLDRIDPSDARLFQDDVWPDWFARLRRDDPVHFTAESQFGPFWSVTKYKDIMKVETNPGVFSSASGITLLDQETQYKLAMFIAMDPPKHDVQRNVVAPIVAPGNLNNMAGTIRQRAAKILDGLPRNETFDWVEQVSIELTTQMLATLFDYPFERRRELTYWSNVATTNFKDPAALVKTEEERFIELKKMAAAMTTLWNERVNAPLRPDLISMLAHGEATRDMDPVEFLGNCTLLIVGGNDTTRNSISGGLWALNKHPDEYRKLRENPGLIPGMVPEIIRWQTPLAYMRRTALEDFELGGKTIRAGEKLAMWYISGNRDPDAIENPDHFIIDRPRPRQHLSFGFGIHRCVGNRLAELQLTILWEEIMKRFPFIEVMEEPKRVYSAFVHGIASMMVRIPR
nr:cytochrome P450 [uncultured Rhodopila sp.]